MQYTWGKVHVYMHSSVEVSLVAILDVSMWGMVNSPPDQQPTPYPWVRKVPSASAAQLSLPVTKYPLSSQG